MANISVAGKGSFRWFEIRLDVGTDITTVDDTDTTETALTGIFPTSSRLMGTYQSATPTVLEDLIREYPSIVGTQDEDIGVVGPWPFIFETSNYSGDWYALKSKEVIADIKIAIDGGASPLPQFARHLYFGKIVSLDPGTITNTPDVTPMTINMRCKKIIVPGGAAYDDYTVKGSRLYYSVDDMVAAVNGVDKMASIRTVLGITTP